MEENQSMNLATDDMLRQLETAGDCIVMEGHAHNSAEELLFGTVPESMNTTVPTANIPLEEQLEQTHIFYADLIEQLNSTNEQKIIDIKSEMVHNTKSSGGNSSNDVKYLIKIMGMVIKRIEAQQYDKAIADLAMTIEEMQ